MCEAQAEGFRGIGQQANIFVLICVFNWSVNPILKIQQIFSLEMQILPAFMKGK